MSDVRGPVCKNDNSQDICVEPPKQPECTCIDNSTEQCIPCGPGGTGGKDQPPSRVNPPKRPGKKPTVSTPVRVKPPTTPANPADPDVGEEDVDVYVPPPPPVEYIVVDAPPPYDPGTTNPPPPPPPGTPPPVVPPRIPVVTGRRPKVSSGPNPLTRLLKLTTWGVGGYFNPRVAVDKLQGPKSTVLQGAGRVSLSFSLPFAGRWLAEAGAFADLGAYKVYGEGNPLDPAYQPSNEFFVGAGGVLKLLGYIGPVGLGVGVDVGSLGTGFVGSVALSAGKRKNRIELFVSRQGANADLDPYFKVGAMLNGGF